MLHITQAGQPVPAAQMSAIAGFWPGTGGGAESLVESLSEPVIAANIVFPFSLAFCCFKMRMYLVKVTSGRSFFAPMPVAVCVATVKASSLHTKQSPDET